MKCQDVRDIKMKDTLNNIVCQSNSDYEALNEVYNYIEKLEKRNKKLEKEYKKVQKIADLIENKYTNGKILWFDSEYAMIYGELCSMAGAGNNRLALVPLFELEKILFNKDVRDN